MYCVHNIQEQKAQADREKLSIPFDSIPETWKFPNICSGPDRVSSSTTSVPLTSR